MIHISRNSMEGREVQDYNILSFDQSSVPYIHRIYLIEFSLTNYRGDTIFKMI